LGRRLPTVDPVTAANPPGRKLSTKNAGRKIVTGTGLAHRCASISTLVATSGTSMGVSSATLEYTRCGTSFFSHRSTTSVPCATSLSQGWSGVFFPSVADSPRDWLEVTIGVRVTVAPRRSEYGDLDPLGFMLVQAFL
jgi:hypothetical protein